MASLRKAQQWLKRFDNEDMPIFGRTVQEIVGIAEDLDSATSELVRVILQDSSMTAKVLKLANSPVYNPQKQRINTVSRAVILLGFDQIRNLALTLTLVDELLKTENRDQLIIELAMAIHAATQARAFAELKNEKNLEEIFIVTLLMRLGSMAFWCRAGDEAQELLQLYERMPNREEAQEQVLGFTLTQLTELLANQWRLSEVIVHALDPKNHRDRRIGLIQDTMALVEAAQQGWQAKKVKQPLAAIANYLGSKDEPKVMELCQTHAREAMQVARQYGAEQCALVIPTEGTVSQWGEAANGDELSQNDPALQLSILRDMAELILQKPDFNLLLEMALEGIYRGIGMDRAMFIVLSPNRKSLKAKYILGQGKDELLQSFRFELDSSQSRLFNQALKKSQALWVGPHDPNLHQAVGTRLRELIGGSEFFLMPLLVSGRPIGLLYADRLASARPLDQESLQNFEFFALQSGLGLAHVMSR